jgi:hypothetical protein
MRVSVVGIGLWLGESRGGQVDFCHCLAGFKAASCRFDGKRMKYGILKDIVIWIVMKFK